MRRPTRIALATSAAAGLFGVVGCASSAPSPGSVDPSADAGARIRAEALASVPSPDPRTDLDAGLFDAEQAVWNMRLLSSTPPSREFVGGINSDLAFTGPYAIQGSFAGFQVWDLGNPSRPALVNAYPCPAAQSDVSTYRNLLFVSGEDYGARLDCGTQGAQGPVNQDRLRGIRIFDITDIRNPRYIGNVQTCRGSHTHSIVEDPSDPAHIYIYVSGSSPVRSAQEMPGCSAAPPSEDPNSALFRIEVIRVPLANPAEAEIVSSPRIFENLVEPETHGAAPEELAELERLRAEGVFAVEIDGEIAIAPPEFTDPLLDSLVARRGGTGAPTAADSATLMAALPGIVEQLIASQQPAGPSPGPTQCHDITVYSEIGLAGGACEGYGFLIDISNPVNPRRIAEVADPNFSYWHSATFDNDGTKVLFTDEWGGGTAPKCRATDPKEWGANAIFSIQNRSLRFESYYKLPAAQSPIENCVAHNGSLLPIPGRDVMAQSWYQGGISVFDWTDPRNPIEIAFHDRGPVSEDEPEFGGTWSVYWYNGVLVSSEITRGLDVLELRPSAFLTENELAAANSVRLEYLNAQTQPRYVWPPSFALARAYVDQLERDSALGGARVAALREGLRGAERASGAARAETLRSLAGEVSAEAGGSRDPEKMRTLAAALEALARG
ncbi:MAG: LVIVD repeat-containing protein [Gemmatimonadales bacterium]